MSQLNQFFSMPMFKPKSENCKPKRESSKVITIENPSMTPETYKYKIRSLEKSKKSSISLSKISINRSKSTANSETSVLQISGFPTKLSNISKVYQNTLENSFDSTNSCLYKNKAWNSHKKIPGHILHETSLLSDNFFSSNSNIKNKIILSSQSFISLKEEIFKSKEDFKLKIQSLSKDIKKIKDGFINKEDKSATKELYIKKIKNNEKKIEMLENENKLLISKLKKKKNFLYTETF